MEVEVKGTYSARMAATTRLVNWGLSRVEVIVKVGLLFVF